MLKTPVDRAQIIALFEGIRAEFPTLQTQLQPEHAHVDLNMDIRKQPGLAFDVNLNLQGDELHLSAGSFWLEWFPCTDPAVTAQYRDAVTGLLSGRYRILEYFAWNRSVRAELQSPAGNSWQTIGTSSNLWRLVPSRRTTRVLQNTSTQ
jgi:hypothetical protein